MSKSGGARKRAKDAARKGVDACRRGANRGKKGLVVFITSDKILQAILTGSVTGVVFSTNEAVAAYIQLALRPLVPIYVPVKLYGALGAAVVVLVAYWADSHTEEWREWVRDAADEDEDEK